MITEQDIKDAGFDPEYGEEARTNEGVFTGYPDALRRYRLIVENYNMSIEEPYFWVKDYLKERVGYPGLIKITDVFSASENSSFFGEPATFGIAAGQGEPVSRHHREDGEGAVPISEGIEDSR